MKALTKETQSQISPTNAVERLLEGNKRFVTKKSADRNLLEQVQDTATGQYPFATVVSCIDSRIPTEIIFDQGIGDIFNARVAGNFVNVDILGSLEFACKLAGSKLIMILGHTSCGAVKGACDNAKLGNLTRMLEKITPAVNAIETKPGEARDSSNIEFVNKVAVENVKRTIDDIKAQSSVLNDMLNAGEIEIVGGMYDVKSGEVSLI